MYPSGIYSNLMNPRCLLNHNMWSFAFVSIKGGPLWLLDIQSRCYSTFFIILCNIVAWPRVWGFWEYKFWLNEQLSHNSGQTSCRIYLKLWDSQARSTFGHATSRPNCSVVSDWSSSLHAFADKLLVSLTSNLVFFFRSLLKKNECPPVCVPNPPFHVSPSFSVHFTTW